MKVTILAGLSALALASAAVAQEPPAPSPEMIAARQAMRAACAADFKTLCEGKEGREAMMCMRQADPAKISDACKDAMAKMPRPPRPAGQ